MFVSMSNRVWVRSSLRWVPKIADWPGHYINVRRCGGLSMVHLQLKDSLELFAKRRQFLHCSGFLSRRDRTLDVESDVKAQTFLPSDRVWNALDMKGIHGDIGLTGLLTMTSNECATLFKFHACVYNNPWQINFVPSCHV